MAFSLYDLFEDLPALRVVDIGASPINGAPPYQPLFAAGRVDLVGFEPDAAQFAALCALGHERAVYLKDAVGDGEEHELHICRSPGMTSLLEPDMEVLQHFHGFAEWGEVLRKETIGTRRLDDVAEARGCDYLKVDVQGGELAVLQNATEVLSDCLVVHIEVQFVPFYKEQPLFSELEVALRDAGFWLHRFLPIHSRVFKPLLVNNDPYAGLSQQLWTDAVYVKRFTEFPTMDREALEKIALIAHDLYGSIDLAALALRALDQREDSQRSAVYLSAITDQLAQAGP